MNAFPFTFDQNTMVTSEINGSGDGEAWVSLNNKGMIIYDENGNLIVEVGVDL